MQRSYRLLVICIVLLIVAGMVLWRGVSDLGVTPKSLPSQTKTEEVQTESSPSASGPAVQLPSSGEIVRVKKVVDGDTIEVESGGEVWKVRFIGVDTPETVDPRRPVGCFGKEASNETHRLLDNQSVILVKDVSNTDKYGRLLRYVYLVRDNDNWLFVNDYLVRNGFAKSSTYPPDVKYQVEFKNAETEARKAGLGMWGSKCNPQ